MVGVEEWYRSLPPLSRAWLTGGVLTGILISLRIPLAGYIDLNWDEITQNFQIWRLFTCFFNFGKISMGWIISLYMLCQYFRALEVNTYPGVRGAAELLFVAGYGMVSIVLLTLLFPLSPAVSLLSMFIYIWSRERPHDPIDIYGFTFQRWHLPAVIVVMTFIFSVSFDPLFAICIGHLWLFITRIVPRVYNKTLVTVPAWWYDGVERYVWQALGGRVDEADRGGARRAPGAGAAPTAGVDARVPGRATWMRGPGHRLDQ